MRSFDFSVKKTDKQLLIEVGKIALRGMGAPEEISFLGFHYNIISKLCEEVAKRDAETVHQTLEAIKEQLAAFS